MTNKPQLIVFASGSKDGGGSGFENLVSASRSAQGILHADIVAVVSNHENGGVRERADRLNVPFEHFPKPWDEAGYTRLLEKYGNPWVSLSGWLKLAVGLNPAKSINIHPGLLPDLGGPGMYGHHVHEAAVERFKEGTLKETAVSMHFVTEKFDDGPLFFSFPVPIRESDDAESLAKRVNMMEHAWQPFITSMVVNGHISWDGVNRDSLKIPDWYPFAK